MRKRFQDRREAGHALADLLTEYEGRNDVIVLGLPRGGVPVARIIADRLSLPMDVTVVRKVGVPGQEELALGAVATGNVFVRNETVIDACGISEDLLEELVEQKRIELDQRHASLGSSGVIDVRGMTAVIVDDGVATGSTIRAAITAVRERGPKEIIAAVPVGAVDTVAGLASVADRVVCPRARVDFLALSLWYRDFEQVSEDTVRRLLAERSYGSPAPSDIE